VLRDAGAFAMARLLNLLMSIPTLAGVARGVPPQHLATFAVTCDDWVNPALSAAEANRPRA